MTVALCDSGDMPALSLLSSALGWLFKKPLRTTEMLRRFPLDLDKTESISSLLASSLPCSKHMIGLQSHGKWVTGAPLSLLLFSLLPIFLSSGLLANVHLMQAGN